MHTCMHDIRHAYLAFLIFLISMYVHVYAICNRFLSRASSNSYSSYRLCSAFRSTQLSTTSHLPLAVLQRGELRVTMG
jgi:hypothetical protein